MTKTALTLFAHEKFGRIRVVDVDGEPWFVGKDVAEALGYSNPRKAILDHVDNEDKGVTKRDTLGGSQDMTIINESGFYSLILSSKLPTAKEFRHWVTSEVLPSIFRTGRYSNSQAPDTITDLFAGCMSTVDGRLDTLERYIVKAGKITRSIQESIGYTNYLLRAQSKATTSTRWKTKATLKLKALADYIYNQSSERYGECSMTRGDLQRKILSGIYNKIQEQYDIDLRDYSSLYEYANNYDHSSMFDVVDSKRILRQYFDSVIDVYMAEYGITLATDLPKKRTIFEDFEQGVAL